MLPHTYHDILLIHRGKTEAQQSSALQAGKLLPMIAEHVDGRGVELSAAASQQATT
jgi:hypothetical protein